MIETLRTDDERADALVASIPSGPPGAMLGYLVREFGLAKQSDVLRLVRARYPRLHWCRQQHPFGGWAVFWAAASAGAARAIGERYMARLDGRAVGDP